MERVDTVVVGAGIAGLACARRLQQAGRQVVVVDKARGVGGRSATRRVLGQPVDHGPLFVHGADPSFLDAVREVPGVLEDWPARIRGEGAPCNPRAFRPGETRLALAGGQTAWAKHLARDLDVRLEHRVTGLAAGDGRLAVEGPGPLAASAVVLTPPAEQTAQLLDTLDATTPGLRAARHLLGGVRSVPCLSLIALYDELAPPDLDLWYPEQGPLLLIGHDSTKRADPDHVALVLQATSRWSREHLEDAPDAWRDALLAAAAELLGPAAARPVATHAHRWRYARTHPGNRLAAPLLVDGPGGTRLGLAGELFAPGGGLQAAWQSGRRLAHRLLEIP